MTPLLLVLVLVLLFVRSSMQFTIANTHSVVDYINQRRRLVYPTAANMNYVSSSRNLEDKALLAAEACAVKFYGNGSEGQTYYKRLAIVFSQSPVSGWMAEKKYYKFDTDSCTVSDGCNNYRQMMYSAITKIGCAINHGCYIDRRKYVVHACYYDKKVSMTPLLGRLYKTGKPGSMCFFPDSNKNFNGLCQVNKSVIIKGETPTCELTACPNCKEFVKATCECVDPLARVSPCTTCGKLGTPCLNGGEDKSTNETECICKCKDNFKGHQCQIEETVYKNGIRLELRHLEKEVAVNPLYYRKIWPSLKPELAEAINIYCRKNATNAQSCCGTEIQGSLAGKEYISAPNLKYIEHGMAADERNLVVAFYLDLQDNNTLCGTAPNVSIDFVNVLKKSLDTSATTKIKGKLLDYYCELDDNDKITSYKAFLDKCIPPTDPGGGVTHQRSGNGTTDATNQGSGDGTTDAINQGSGSDTTVDPTKPESGVCLRSGLSALHLLALQVTVALLLTL